MTIRTTVDLPSPLLEQLRLRSATTGRSVPSLILQALEEAYGERAKKRQVTGPLIRGTGKLGPAFPTDENLHDLAFPDLNVCSALSRESIDNFIGLLAGKTRKRATLQQIKKATEQSWGRPA